MSRLHSFLSSVPNGLIGTTLTTASVTLFGFLSNFLLARWMGPEAFGAFAYATAWVLLLNIFSLVGMHNLVLRELAKALALRGWGKAKALVNWSRLLVATVSVIVGAVFWLFSHVALGSLEPDSLRSLWVALLALPFLSQVRLGGSILRSLDKIVISQLPGSVIGPGLFVLTIIGSHFVLDLGPVYVVSLYVASYAVAYLLTHGLIRAYLPSELGAVRPEILWRQWLVMAIPFLLTGGMHILNTRIDVIMLGLQRTPQDVGIYTVASRGADLVLLSLMIVNIVVAPAIAKFHALGDEKALQKTVTDGARFSLLGAVILATTLTLGASWFLALFGPDYPLGARALVLLCVGNLINVAAGPIIQILDMTDRASVVALGFGFGIVLNVILNLLLVPRFGMNGAAVATMSSAISWNVVLGLYVYARLNINPTAFRIRS